MPNNEKWLEWAVELQSLAQAGLYYNQNPYELERFERIRDIAVEMLAYKTTISPEKIKEIFCCERGYQTPKLDSRAVIFQDEAILLVQEAAGGWSLPGGWVDVNLSVGQNAVKEVAEEAGLTAVAERIIAVQDKDKHNPPAHAIKICKVFVLCTALGGAFHPNTETIASGYFPLDGLPELCTEKTTREQIAMCFDAYHDPAWQVAFD